MKQQTGHTRAQVAHEDGDLPWRGATNSSSATLPLCGDPIGMALWPFCTALLMGPGPHQVRGPEELSRLAFQP